MNELRKSRIWAAGIAAGFLLLSVIVVVMAARGGSEGQSMYIAAEGPAAVTYVQTGSGEPEEAGTLSRGQLVRTTGKVWQAPEGDRMVSVRRVGEESAEQPAEGLLTPAAQRLEAATAGNRAGAASEAQESMRPETGAPLPGGPAGRLGRNGQTLLVKEENLREALGDIVLEETVFARTPATIYRQAEGAEIAGFAPKGSELQVTGYDRVTEDGTVHKYRVKLGDTEGFVYGKYLALSEKEAKARCNEKGAMDMAGDAAYDRELYGGKATHLDYFPYESTEIEGNEFCRNARAMYLNAGAAVKEKYLRLAKENEVNAVVINIDGGTLAYRSPAAKELCPTAYKHAHYSVEKYRKAVAAYREAGIYTIGRIACFNDENYAKDHAGACIRTGGKKTRWVSAYSRDAWYYKVSLAVEAVELMGFNEIQFDYVRFPESSYEWSASGNTDYRNEYGEEKAQAIQNFCFYAADQIHEAGAYFSVDVFGECSNGYVTAYGQYWPAISNIVDAISSMPYTDHHGESDTWTHPYSTLHAWAKRSARMQRHIPTPAAARTWITGYNTPYWAPSVDYDYGKLKEQVKALEDAGLDGGFIPWNSSSDYGKYKEYRKIWRK